MGIKEKHLHADRFGDLDGDGRDDYLIVDPDTSAVHFWKNGGPLADGKWLWIDEGRVASGGGLGKGKGVRFADLDGDGKVDFIYLDAAGRAVNYLNGGSCASCDGGWLVRADYLLFFSPFCI